ncbi:MAG TPA: hypothetical protein VEJ67_01370 [Candidatus Cybelea sp.]|nr:hypothetical protein [Candidatus Cybelea sp.]
MKCLDQSGRSIRSWISLLWLPQIAPLFGVVMLCAARGPAQQAPTPVGNIEGSDISVAAGGLATVTRTNPDTPTEVANGGVVTVRTGQARLMLTSGGELDICAPARFSLVQSGDDITVALDLGTVRVQLPASTSLRVFTPEAIATPLDIHGAPRDATLALGQDDSLRVKAAAGALLIENQFSSHRLVIPEGGEFSFAQGRLVPLAENRKCECIMEDAHTLARTPVRAVTEPAAASSPPDSKGDTTESNIEYSVLAHANETHPLRSRPKPDAVAAPPDTVTYKVVMPPLTFSAASPTPPPAPTSDLVLLIRTVEVESDFEFTGRVNPPSPGQPPKHGQAKADDEQHGFWARVKRFFVGSSS